MKALEALEWATVRACPCLDLATTISPYALALHRKILLEKALIYAEEAKTLQEEVLSRSEIERR